MTKFNMTVHNELKKTTKRGRSYVFLNKRTTIKNVPLKDIFYIENHCSTILIKQSIIDFIEEVDQFNSSDNNTINELAQLFKRNFDKIKNYDFFLTI